MRRLVSAVVAVSAVVLAASVPAVPARAASTFVVLQMNLCNSGMAVTSCYSSGRAVDEAVERIHRYPPDLVTLQEVCRDDLFAGDGRGKLTQAMADLYGGAYVSVDFAAIRNRFTGGAYRCVNGHEYGVAVLYRGNGRDVHRGWYDSQDDTDEVRAWTCATVVVARLTGCTTHLSTDGDVAMRQCRELMAVLASPWVLPEVVVAGDFNLVSGPGGPSNLRDCAPPSYDRRSDGSVQHVLFTRNIRGVRGMYEGMRWTDHPLLYERLRI
jgi:endonuclease/exonuclease/phosphatase family metal-dependent hydrolase